jgi:putative endonuclease
MYGPWVRVPAGSRNPFKLEGFFILNPYTYILFSCKLNKYYVGACTNLDRRLYEYNIGHLKYTKLGIPWKLVWQKSLRPFLRLKNLKQKIKKQKSRKYIEALIDSGHP